ncbi:hypothetical protein EAE91_23070 [Photorhabdus noenieputensis]|uniref:hypothetical protein n=1 Tax=Photorhabdus noenieputensis TaxID=1208607 RepID=UPI001BD6107D|nr:hypothetical protein [Photorhabdus noenieputensis]MBS9439922.1 hypothetical protein [Photorhabdus noenieputensis]MCK3669886.1 hypothetical protein [Photorhabdus noenieputensis]
MTIQLIPEKTEFRISTTDLETVYTESNGIKLRLDVQHIDDFKNDTYRDIEIHFLVVAELRCITMNFFDINHQNYAIDGQEFTIDVIDFWEKYGYHPDSGFYQINNSDILISKKSLYDPRNNLDLKHYLINGYDSHIEIIASKYEYRYL